MGEVGRAQTCEYSLDTPELSNGVDSTFVEGFDQLLFLSLWVKAISWRHVDGYQDFVCAEVVAELVNKKKIREWVDLRDQRKAVRDREPT